MKIFNTIQELWDYCLFCPVCRQDSREVEVKVGPSAVFELVFCSKETNSLKMWCNYKNKKNVHSIEYDINCLDNSFQMNVVETKELDVPQSSATLKRLKPYFFFWIQSNCRKCSSASAHSMDFELDIVDRKISNIKLERESIYLSNDYHITLFHDSGTMLVSRPSSDVDSDYKPIKLPLVTLDLSDQAKIINKIKTLILFS